MLKYIVNKLLNVDVRIHLNYPVWKGSTPIVLILKVFISLTEQIIDIGTELALPFIFS
jgi:hypothetical protein